MLHSFTATVGRAQKPLAVTVDLGPTAYRATIKAYFDPGDWNVQVQGLIHGDEQFLTDLIDYLEQQQHLRYACDLRYSAREVQGRDHVDLDVSPRLRQEILAAEHLHDAMAPESGSGDNEAVDMDVDSDVDDDADEQHEAVQPEEAPEEEDEDTTDDESEHDDTQESETPVAVSQSGAVTRVYEENGADNEDNDDDGDDASVESDNEGDETPSC